LNTKAAQVYISVMHVAKTQLAMFASVLVAANIME